jgi:hypothetical protein
MGHSEEYKKLKKHYHEDRYGILKVEANLSNEEEDWGRVVFDAGDTEIEVTGSSSDFIMSIFDLKGGFAERDEGILDISATPAGDPQGYYELLEYFIDPPNEDRQEKAFERVQSGETDIPDSIGLEDALQASLEGEMDHPDLKIIVENYHEVIALRMLHMRQVDAEIKKYKQKQSHNQERFVKYLNLAGDILQDRYFTESPLEGYQDYNDTCIADIEFLMNKLLDIKQRHEELMRDVEVDGDGRLDSATAIPNLLDQYARYYELAGDPLRDLAVSLEGAPVEELSEIADVLKFLDKSGHSELAGVVDPDLRNGAFHLSYEVDHKDGVISIFSGRDKGRYQIAEYGFQEFVSEYRYVQDVVPAIIFSYVTVSEILTVQYLRSNDFVSRIVEEADPEMFD